MLNHIENIQREVSAGLDKETRSRLGQFFTPQTIARFMASLFEINKIKPIRLLDAGAGIGSLTAAFIEKYAEQNIGDLEVMACEVDSQLVPILEQNLNNYRQFFAEDCGDLTVKTINKDFIEYAVPALENNEYEAFDYAILNPPYHKINSDSSHRKLLRKAGIETVNLYSAFVALSLKLLKKEGQMVVIIPRSFCNGPYYKPFRQLLLSLAAINHIHLFKARNKAFKEDKVLQENVILHLTKGAIQNKVTISNSAGGQFSDYQEWEVPFTTIVRKQDPDVFIHIPSHQGESVLHKSDKVGFSLEELGINVSTGPVVDFRAKEFLQKMPGQDTAPLIYPAHFNGWTVTHPINNFKKNNAIEVNDQTMKSLFPSGFYTIIRRFSSKEEKRRIIARVIRPIDIDGEFVGFENHLNVLHYQKQGLQEEIAFGMAVYLNSTAVDEYFRLFSGHTQVNATDLKLIKYPALDSLKRLGTWGKSQTVFLQEEVDKQVAKIL